MLLKLLVVGMLLGPLVFQLAKVKEFHPLHGVQESKYQLLADSLDGEENYFDGTWQRLKAYQLQEELLIRNPMIKMRNQIEFSMFGKVNAEHMYRYGDQYFRFYCVDYHEGYLFKGEQEINDQVKRLKAVQEVLSDSIPIISAIAPSKTYLYGELLPEFNTKQTEYSNYKYIKKTLIENDMHCLDFNQWFVDIKGTEEAPLMGSGGVHWSRYGSTLAMDSLVNYVNVKTGSDFRRPTWVLEDSDTVCYHDNDAAKLSNLLIPPYDKELKNVNFLPAENNKSKMKALIISDSFFDVVSIYGLRDQIFTTDSKYDYYYGTQIGIPAHNQRLESDEFMDYIKSVDCVIIMSDIVNMENYGWGFVEEAYEKLVVE